MRATSVIIGSILTFTYLFSRSKGAIFMVGGRGNHVSRGRWLNSRMQGSSISEGEEEGSSSLQREQEREIDRSALIPLGRKAKLSISKVGLKREGCG